MAPEYRINEQIRVPEVLLIGEDGERMGVVKIGDARRRAEERELDLVEVAPQADPPVCRLLDYGRFRYAQMRKQREARRGSRAGGVMREVRVRPRIGGHDVDAKVRQVRKLLGEGSKVKLSVMFRGREMAHPEQGVELLRRMAENVQEEARVEQAPSLQGRFLSIVLIPGRKDGRAGAARRRESDRAEGSDGKAEAEDA